MSRAIKFTHAAQGTIFLVDDDRFFSGLVHPDYISGAGINTGTAPGAEFAVNLFNHTIISSFQDVING